MKKVAVVVLAMALLMMFATVAPTLASPIKEKNNAKFEEWYDTGTFSLLMFLQSEHTYTPSLERINKLVMTFEETMSAYVINVDGNTYTLGVDFTYSGLGNDKVIGPVFDGPSGLLYPSGSREGQLVVNYMFDFSAYEGGLDGTLQMRAEFNAGGLFINSLAGTGDLRNVQVKATQTDEGGFNPVTFDVTVVHRGIVSGWPE